MSAPFRGKSFQMVIVQQTAAEWADTSDRVLQDYELGQETDTGLAKMGDGVTTWADLDYWSPSSNAKRYIASLTQSGSSAPVATVLENTLGGTVVWTRGSAGLYDATLSGAFTAGKTMCTVTGSIAGYPVLFTSVAWVSANVIRLSVLNVGTFAIVDNWANVMIEITVYP